LIHPDHSTIVRKTLEIENRQRSIIKDGKPRPPKVVKIEEPAPVVDDVD